MYMGQCAKFWYLLYRQAAKAHLTTYDQNLDQTSLDMSL